MSYQQYEQTLPFVPQCPEVHTEFNFDECLFDNMLDCSMARSSFKQKMKRQWQLFHLLRFS